MKLKIMLLINSVLFLSAAAMEKPTEIKIIGPGTATSAKLPEPVSVTASISLQNHAQPVSSVVFLPNNRIASGSYDKTVVISDLNTQEKLKKLSNLGIVTALAINPTHNLLDIGSASQSLPLFYDYKQNKFIGSDHAADAVALEGVSAITVVDPLTIATGHSNGYVLVTRTRGVGMGGSMQPFMIGKAINAIASSSIEKILAISTKANVIFMINEALNNVTPIPLPPGFTSPQSIVILSPARWAVGLLDGRILILEQIRGKNEMRVLESQGPAGAVPIQSLSALNQTFLVSGSADGSVKIWNTETAKEIFSLKPANKDQGVVFSVASELQGNSAKIAAGYENGTVSVWKDVNLTNINLKESFDEIKKNYFMISAWGPMPVWVRIKNTYGIAYVEQEERKKPLIHGIDRDAVRYYQQSSFPDRILVSSNEPLLIPYNQMKYPLKMRAWSFANKDNADDDSNAIVIQLTKELIDDLRSKSSKIEFEGYPAYMTRPSTKKEITLSTKGIDEMDKDKIEMGFGKILKVSR
jgi:WD40 repeat protein